MPNLAHLTYNQTGKSKSTNALGMREMQEKAYEGRYGCLQRKGK